MPQPDADGSELDGGEEVVVSLVVAGGDGAVLLEFAEGALDEIAGIIKCNVAAPSHQ